VSGGGGWVGCVVCICGSGICGSGVLSGDGDLIGGGGWVDSPSGVRSYGDVRSCVVGVGVSCVSGSASFSGGGPIGSGGRFDNDVCSCGGGVSSSDIGAGGSGGHGNLGVFICGGDRGSRGLTRLHKLGLELSKLKLHLLYLSAVVPSIVCPRRMVDCSFQFPHVHSCPFESLPLLVEQTGPMQKVLHPPMCVLVAYLGFRVIALLRCREMVP
jgi:hypothetical protein